MNKCTFNVLYSLFLAWAFLPGQSFGAGKCSQVFSSPNIQSLVSQPLFSKLVKTQMAGWTKLKSPVRISTSVGRFSAKYVIGQSLSIVLLDPATNTVIKVYRKGHPMAKNEALTSEYLYEAGENIPKVDTIEDLKFRGFPFLDGPGEYTVVVKDFFSGLASESFADHYGMKYFDMELYKEIWRQNSRINNSYFSPGQFQNWLKTKHPEIPREEARNFGRDGKVIPNFLYTQEYGWVLIDP